MTDSATTVLWRLVRHDPSSPNSGTHSHARAIVLPGGPPFTLAVFVDDEMERIENYAELGLALFRSTQIHSSLTAEGWTE